MFQENATAPTFRFENGTMRTLGSERRALAQVQVHEGRELGRELPRLGLYAQRGVIVPLSRDPAWLKVLATGLGQTPLCVEAVGDRGETRGILPLVFMKSWLFGRFLVGMPYLNAGGVLADDQAVGQLLIDRAINLGDELGVRFLELRHERSIPHDGLVQAVLNKVEMRLELRESISMQWKELPGKVRNQVRKGERNAFAVCWGGQELLPEFFAVFSRNMRDLGTPVFGKALFRSILDEFPGQAEICVLRAGRSPVSAALLLHGRGVTEVPSASTLRSHFASCANMFLYWSLIGRAIERGQTLFDFGRCTRGGNTYQFKKQWGATATDLAWQYYLRRGDAGDMRPENPRYRRLSRLWQWLPLWVATILGPRIVRGIP